MNAGGNFNLNRLTVSGGGIANYNGGTVTVSNSTFSGNSAVNGGGISNNKAAR